MVLVPDLRGYKATKLQSYKVTKLQSAQEDMLQGLDLSVMWNLQFVPCSIARGLIDEMPLSVSSPALRAAGSLATCNLYLVTRNS